MLNRRYSHQRAARIASPIFVVFGLVGGAVAGQVIPGSPSPIFNAVLWGVVGGIAGYIVFASEGPQQRPASIVQAAVADGVVAGIITALSGALVDVISASGAGSSTPGSLSLGGAVLAVALAAILGALVGACAGALALAIGGRERFERLRVNHQKRGSSTGRAKPRTSNRKPARQRRKR